MSWFFVFFFFKQKTAYEMRISDWSSDVCSSDLLRGGHGLRPARCRRVHQAERPAPAPAEPPEALTPHPFPTRSLRAGRSRRGSPRPPRRPAAGAAPAGPSGRRRPFPPVRWPRSEEHTSELQSLMRISSAVFCLKKKKSLKLNHNVQR